MDRIIENIGSGDGQAFSEAWVRVAGIGPLINQVPQEHQPIVRRGSGRRNEDVKRMRTAVNVAKGD